MLLRASFVRCSQRDFRRVCFRVDWDCWGFVGKFMEGVGMGSRGVIGRVSRVGLGVLWRMNLRV